jgi:hypothetical protein
MEGLGQITIALGEDGDPPGRHLRPQHPER